jgi:U3 small nucleolar RNA-associated protein 10
MVDTALPVLALASKRRYLNGTDLYIHSVHEYNTDWLILTFLPYHSTPLFLSLLSILPPKISPIFRFLYPSIIALENPQYHVIVQTAKSNDAFFTAFNRYVLKVARAGHHSSVLLSFWASVATQAVDGRISAAQSGRETIQKQKQEGLLLQILPVLNEALSLPNVPDLILGSCMIITVLAAKAHLEDLVLDGLMEAVASGWNVSTIDARITCLAILSQERAATDLSKDTIKKLLKCGEFADQVKSVAQRYRVDRLTLGYISGCFKRLHRAHGDRLKLDSVAKLLKADLLTQPQLRIAIRDLLSSVKKLQDAGTLATPEQRTNLADVVTYLAESTKWSGVFQKALSKSSYSQDELELSLQTVITRAIEVAPTEADGNVEMIDAPSAVSEFDSAISTVADKELSSPSFLSSAKSKDFKHFAALYILAISSEQNIKKFLDIPALRPEGGNGSLPLISFLIRLLCSQYPPVARVVALRIISDNLKAAVEPDQDFQCLIPYLIVALSDRSATVRRSAAECTVVLGHQYKLLLSSDEQNVTPPVLGKGTIYSTEASTAWTLSTKEAGEFVRKVLLPDLEECVLDASNVSIVLGTAIDAGSGSNTPQKAASLNLKLGFRSAIFTAVASHAVSTPLINVKARLLDILRRVGKSGHGARSKILIPALKTWIISPPIPVNPNMAVLQLEVDLAFLWSISPREKEGLSLFKDIVTGHLPGLRPEVLQSTHQVLQEIWPSLNPGEREEIALALFEASQSSSDNAVMSNLAMESLRSLSLPTNVLVALIESLPNALQMPDQPPSAKRRRTSRNEMSKMASVNSNDLELALRRYTVVLEIIDGSKAANHPQLLKGLFHALGEIHHYRAQTESEMVYLQGLTINSLLAIVDKLKVCHCLQVLTSF